MKVKSLAVGMIVPLAASVALATAPTASAATPTKAAFTHSGVSADGRGVGYGHYGYGAYGYGWYNGWGTNEARYHPYEFDLYGGVGPVAGSWKRCERWGLDYQDYSDTVQC